jgi:hypothetical protein
MAKNTHHREHGEHRGIFSKGEKKYWRKKYFCLIGFKRLIFSVISVGSVVRN